LYNYVTVIAIAHLTNQYQISACDTFSSCENGDFLLMEETIYCRF